MKKRRIKNAPPLKIAHQFYLLVSFVLRLDDCTYQNPLPALAIVDESSDDGSGEITAS